MQQLNTPWRQGVGESPEQRYVTPRLRRAATRLFALEAGTAPATSESLAAVLERLMDKMSQRLAQVIGPGGVEAIFLRVVKLRKSEFAFLDERILRSATGDNLAAPLRASLQAHEPDVIREVSVTLFATFAGLLAAIIGDPLMWSLLQQIWPDTLPAQTELQETEE